MTSIQQRPWIDEPVSVSPADDQSSPTDQAQQASRDDPKPAITTESLSVSYRGRWALRDVTLAIRPGRITAMVGPSGCGKTSFLFCLNRLTDLVPHCRVTGNVIVGATDVYAAATDVTRLRRRVGKIFQNPNPFPLSIRGNIELPVREHYRLNRSALAQVVEAALRDVGLWDQVKDRLDASALGLSGGQQQRLCLARALALKPHVVLMDEPCSALDPIASGMIEDLIASLRNRVTVVVVTHNLAQAKRLADDVAVWGTCEGVGKLLESGDRDTIFSTPRLEATAAYLQGQRA